MPRFLLLTLLILYLGVPVSAQATFHTTATATEKAVKLFKEAKTAIQEGDVAGAIRKYNKCIDLDSLFIDAFIYLGGAHKRAQNWSDAERALEKASHKRKRRLKSQVVLERVFYAFFVIKLY